MSQEAEAEMSFEPNSLDKIVWAFSRHSDTPNVYLAQWALAVGLGIDLFICYGLLLNKEVISPLGLGLLPVPWWVFALSLFGLVYVVIHFSTHSVTEIETIQLADTERRVYAGLGVLIAFGWGPGVVLIGILNGAVFL